MRKKRNRKKKKIDKECGKQQSPRRCWLNATHSVKRKRAATFVPDAILQKRLPAQVYCIKNQKHFLFSCHPFTIHPPKRVNHIFYKMYIIDGTFLLDHLSSCISKTYNLR